MSSVVPTITSALSAVISNILVSITKPDFFIPPLAFEFKHLPSIYLVVGEYKLDEKTDTRYFNIAVTSPKHKYPLDIVSVVVSDEGIGLDSNGCKLSLYTTAGDPVMPTENILSVLTLIIRTNPELIAICQPAIGGLNDSKQTRK